MWCLTSKPETITFTSFSRSVQLCSLGHGTQTATFRARWKFSPIPEYGLCGRGLHSAEFVCQISSRQGRAATFRSESTWISEPVFSCCDMEGLDKIHSKIDLPLLPWAHPETSKSCIQHLTWHLLRESTQHLTIKMFRKLKWPHPHTCALVYTSQ